MGRASPRFRHDLARDQQPQLDAHSGEPDPFAARLRARGDVVVTRQFTPLHPAAVVHDRQSRVGGVGRDADRAGAGIKRVGDDLGQDRVLERAAVGVSEVFEEVLKVDARLAHVRIVALHLR
jgi:hypothetical protein